MPNPTFSVDETIGALDRIIQLYTEFSQRESRRDAEPLFLLSHIDAKHRPCRFIVDFVQLGVSDTTSDPHLQWGVGIWPGAPGTFHTLERARELRSWQDDPSKIAILPATVFLDVETRYLQTLRDGFDTSRRLCAYVV